MSPKASTRKPAPGTPIRTLRVDDELWEAAHAKAIQRGEYVSEVLRQRLREYVADE